MLLPQFNTIPLTEIPTQLKQLLANNLQKINAYLSSDNPLNWADFMPFMDDLQNRLHCFWSPIQHLHAVKNTPALRDIYQEGLSLLTEYHTVLGHHEKLFQAYQTIQKKEKEKLTDVQNRILTLNLRDFHLSGVDLNPEEKERHAAIEQKLAQLSTSFGEHVLDATEAWHYLVTDIEQLQGLPAHIIETARQNAEKQAQKGWRLTLDYPCYSAVMKHADDAALREKFYYAYVTRASTFGEAKQDNTELMLEILQQRHQLAELLGFKNYAELSLATKMANKPNEVIAFLDTLLSVAKPRAQEELKTLSDFAGKALSPWDVSYFSEQYQQKHYQLQQETLRPYFPATQVIQGLFNLVKKIFGLTIQPVENANVWHPDVSCYAIYDNQKNLRGFFYLDLYVRAHKREGAWMDDFCSRWKQPNGDVQHPVAYLTCNFTAPQPEQPALLTHDDVITLFHEFGHGLHHLLTTVDYLDISGLHHVPWDAVELPSQFMENWCWQPQVLKALSRHYQTGQSLPDEMIDSLLSSRHFQAALQLVRQLEFALFDFHLHLHLQKPHGTHYLQEIMDEVRKKTALMEIPSYNRSQNTFSHIFDGGYAAGYYSYLWAEVLAADAFEGFVEQGLYNIETGQRFVDTILSKGGSEPIEDLFKQFRGRAPDSKALLRAWGLL